MILYKNKKINKNVSIITSVLLCIFLIGNMGSVKAEVNIDIAMLQKHLIELENITDEAKKKSLDLDNNSSLTVNDLTLLIRKGDTEENNNSNNSNENNNNENKQDTYSIKLKGSKEITIEVLSVYTEDDYTAVNQDNVDKTGLVKISGQVDNKLLGEYTLEYYILDSDGKKVATVTRKVTVVDTQKPEIEFVDNVNIVKGDSFDILSNVSAKDNYDGDITGNIQIVSNNLNTNIVGKHDIEYMVKDSSNNEIKKVRTVNVVESNEPINPYTFEINNSYFGISSDGTNSVKTTEGINNAIEYASQKGYTYIKLENGQYLIDCARESNYWANSVDGIFLKSNMHLDLNGSKMIVETNSSPAYSLFCIYDVENVKISNGILVGDRDTHTYGTYPNLTSDEFGYGLDIRSSFNVEVYDLEICDMTGDGIIISVGHDVRLSDGGVTPADIIIRDNEIYNCRRQGISVIGGTDIDIYRNEIHDINGTSPASGIDLEGELDRIIENVNIYENNFYGMEGSSMIFHRRSNNCTFENNTVKGTTIASSYKAGGVSVYNGKNHIIKNNKIEDSRIFVYNENLFPELRINKTLVENNTLNNSYIQAINCENFVLRNNKLEDSFLATINADGAVYHNVLNDTIYRYGMKIRSDDGNLEGHKVYWYNNQITLLGVNKDVTIEGNPRVYTNLDELKTYLNSININY